MQAGICPPVYSSKAVRTGYVFKQLQNKMETMRDSLDWRDTFGKGIT